MDLTGLVLAVAMAFGLLGADAAMNADTLTVQINVPASLDGSIDRSVAEQIFSTEIARMVQTPSLVSPPMVRSTTDKTLIGVMATSLNLDDITFALQRAVGLKPVRLNGAIMPNDQGARFLLTATSSVTGPFIVDLRSPDKDYVDLVRRAAHQAMERIYPYRAALYHFEQAAEAGKLDELTLAETIALRDLAQPLRQETLERRALFLNLLGMIGLMRADVAEAERRFAEAIAQREGLAIAHLNLAFVRLHQERYEAAIVEVRRVLEPKPLTRSPQLLTAAHTTRAVAEWALGRHDAAAALFAAATRDQWGTTAAYGYWARMLGELGRTAEADRKALLARANLPYFDNYAESAMFYFELDHRHSDTLIRR